MPFFPRILIHFVRLHLGVGSQEAPRHCLVRQLLQAMPPFQQVFAIAFQLAGQLRRRDGLGNSSQKQQQFARTPVGPLQDGSCPRIENRPAVRTLVVQDRISMTTMNAQPLTSLTRWARICKEQSTGLAS